MDFEPSAEHLSTLPQPVDDPYDLASIASPAALLADTAGDADSVAPLAFEELFGEYFKVDDDHPVDPALVDTRNMLLRLFGTCVCEEDLDFSDEKQARLAQEMADNKAATRFATVEKCFGVDGAAALEEEVIEPFGCLLSSLPEDLDIGACEEVWLTNMPKIAPNRQTLHMHPQPFLPSQCAQLHSTERSLYTTQNVARWAHHAGSNTFMSNARVVRWSDGSVTLHVGSDLFALQASKERALTMLALPTVVRKGEGPDVPAMVSALYPNEHYVVEGATAGSIEEAILAESAQFRSVATQHNLAYGTGALPNINWNKITAPQTAVEEYVMKEYNRRQKLIEQRRREGRPMTLTEQMDMENEFLQRLQSASAEELLERHEEEQREAALRATARQQVRRSRFDRTVELEGGSEGPHNDDYINDERQELGTQENGEDVEEEDDYEVMLEAMRKRQRESDDRDDAERRRRVHEHEGQQARRHGPLIAALGDLIPHIPIGTNALSSVLGTLDFLGKGAFAPGVVVRELPMMLREVSEECPGVDLSAVQQEFERLYPQQ